jgi:ATP-binding cassette subfamily B protein
MYLMQRLYDYDSGKITIGGADIREYKRKYLRRNVGIVLQEPFLYSRSIRDNIAITRPSASEREIREVSHISALGGVINEFSKGYDTEVGERGVTLSGGQKQRVAIARMLMQNTPFLIFDDSLSAVDTETDQTIRRRLKRREGKATTFIISHRITTLSEADLILVMENGKIVQSGTHAQLCAQPGLYRRVWEIQNATGEK